MNAWMIIFLLILFSSSPSDGQERKSLGPAPVPVGVSQLRLGTVTPEVEFTGTVSFPEVSEVAAESSGRIEMVRIEEGKRVKKGESLVDISSELLEKTLQGVIATREETLGNLEKARGDLSRIETLHRRQVVSDQLYDENRSKVADLEKKAAMLKADVDRLKAELEKKSVRAPFDGLVIKRWVNPGEWLQPGRTVATVARDDRVDIVADVPEKFVKVLRIGMEAKVKVAGEETNGTLAAFVPVVKAAARTFSIKVRISNTLSLLGGMEARVTLPGRESKKSLMAAREAILLVFGQPAIFAVIDNKAILVPVKVIGTQGQHVGIEGTGLTEGLNVVVKGHERLRDGQEVTLLPKGK